MRIRDVLDQAIETGALMRSRERHEVELTFASPVDAERFDLWCEDNAISTNGWITGSFTVTVLAVG